MITQWIIQPQIDKLAEQKKQLDSFRVDLKVQTILVKREILYKQFIRAEIEFQRFVRAIKQLGELFQNFKRQAYPTSNVEFKIGGFQLKDSGLKNGEHIYTHKKNINGNN
jgi:hypothetical protein